MDGFSPNQFKGVHMNVNPVVDDLLTLIIVLYDLDILDEHFTGELAKLSVQKYESTVKLLRYNIHIRYVRTLITSFNLSFVRIVTLSSKGKSTWSDN